VEAQRSRTIAAAPADAWAVVGDPRSLARWWPRTERVEGLREGRWTTVLRSPRGRVVRADWRLDGPEERGRRRAWAQQVEGTPFAQVIKERRVEAEIEPDGTGTRVTLRLRQRSRKLGRIGDLVLLRPARRELDEALAALAGVLEGAPGGDDSSRGPTASSDDDSSRGPTTR
jgi:uncharacterized protein YndB with AHSA1/START domain